MAEIKVRFPWWEVKNLEEVARLMRINGFSLSGTKKIWGRYLARRLLHEIEPQISRIFDDVIYQDVVRQGIETLFGGV
ncbi:MAG: hypothetical protein WC600_17045 [Desulfobaccales bacterium]